MTIAEMFDQVLESKLLVDTLRDAICNPEIHSNTESYWVLIDYIRDKLSGVEHSLESMIPNQD